MRALVTGISTWIIPTLAAAARSIHERARKTRGSEIAHPPSGDKGSAEPEDRSRNPAVMHDRIKAKVEAMIWPD